MSGRLVELRVVQLASRFRGTAKFILEEKPALRCVMQANGKGVRLHWQDMLTIGRYFAEMADKACAAKGFVDVLFDGKKVASVFPNVAKDLFAVGAINVARRAEELEKHAQVAEDGAVLIRAGIPVGLAVDPRVQNEAAHLAVNDASLRRYMPGGVQSTMMPLPPTIATHAPTPAQKIMYDAWKREKHQAKELRR